MSAAAFREYWLTRHGPLVAAQAEALKLRKYVQSHPFDDPASEANRRAWVGLAGMRIDPATNVRVRTGHSTGISLRGLGAGAAQVVSLPAGARVGDVRWSHTSRRLAFTLTRDGLDGR